MPTDLPSALALIKELGALGMLALILWKGIPALVACIDRNTRILYRIEGKLGITDTDRLENDKTKEA